MKPLDLRSLYAELDALPRYVPAANSLSDEAAAAIADKFGEVLDDVRDELAQANQYAAERVARADTRGDGLGLFRSAEHLFFGYLYELHREAYCDSIAAARSEFQD